MATRLSTLLCCLLLPCLVHPQGEAGGTSQQRLRGVVIAHVDDLTEAQQALLSLRDATQMQAWAESADCVLTIEDARAYLYPKDLFGLEDVGDTARLVRALAASLDGAQTARISELPDDVQQFVRRFLRDQGSSAMLARNVPEGASLQLEVSYQVSLRAGDRVARGGILHGKPKERVPKSFYENSFIRPKDGDGLPDRGTGLYERRALPLRFTMGPHSNTAVVRMMLVRRLSEMLEERLRKADQEFAEARQVMVASLFGRDVPAKGRRVSDLDEADRRTLLNELGLNFKEQGFASLEDAEEFLRSAIIDSARPTLFLRFGYMDSDGNPGGIGIQLELRDYP